MSFWFEEPLETELGRTLKIRCSRRLAEIKSPFQTIEVLESDYFGRILVHDKVIMLTARDERNYHEMIAQVPLNVHPQPSRVLIIGGGDGGTLREVLKHSRVESAHLCELDEQVVEVSRRYFPKLSASFSDPRVTLFFQDGAAFVAEKEDYYDLIIVDSSDPESPAEALFDRNFYENLHRALRPDGIAVTQSESFIFNLDLLTSIASFASRIFTVYDYYYALVPSYPSGIIGFSFCSKQRHPLNDMLEEKAACVPGLTYYNREIHRAAFQLPAYAVEALGRILG